MIAPARLSRNLAALLALAGSSSSAATYYVATNGDDARPCGTATSLGAPKRSIKNALGCLKAGDTLLIRGGVYAEALNEYEVRIPSGTSWSNAVTIAGYPEERAIMRPNREPPGSTNIVSEVIRVMGPAGGTHHVIFQNLVLDAINLRNYPGQTLGRNVMKMTNAGRIAANNAHHIRVEGCEVMNASGQGILGCGEYSEILNNNIHHNGDHRLDHGLYCSSKGLLVEGNEVHHNSSYGLHIYASGKQAGPDIVVRNNRTHDNPSAGIIVGGLRTLAYNNVSWDNGSGIDVKYSQSRDIMIYNNTTFSNTRYGIFVYNAPNTKLVNNIAYKNGVEIKREGSNPGLIELNNLIADPLFVNVGQLNFRLRPGSPAIDRGSNLSATFTTDAVGARRPHGSGFDIGAFEFGGSVEQPPVRKPRLPTNFRLR